MATVRRTIVLLAALVALSLPLGATPSAAKPLDSCRGIDAMGQPYGLGKKKVRCAFVRRWARHYLKHGQQPRGWECFGRFFEVGNCHTPGNESLFQFYVED
jgi:hypothetical protein